MWRGRDTLLDREVAVKQIDVPDGVPEDERGEIRQRFLREARTAGRLRHRSATTVHDVVEEDGSPFIIMEYVDAPNLAEVVEARGPLTEQRAAAVALDVLDALSAAHSQGIVHRDVKPSNVMVPDDGPAILTDFGIATFAGDPRITQTGTAMGSPAYMSPEQARDEELGRATDLWGLGATLYFAVEGRPPFKEDGTASTLRAVVSEPPARFERVDRLAPVIWGLLEKELADRPGADEVRELLLPVREGDDPPIEDTRALGTAATTQAMAGPAADVTEELRADTEPARTRGREAEPSPRPAPPPTSEEPRGTRDPGRRDGTRGPQRATAAIVLTLIAIVGVLGLLWLLGDGGTEVAQDADRSSAEEDEQPPADDQPAPETEQGADDAAPEEEPTAEDGSVGSAPEEDDASVPEDWEIHEAEGEPYAIAHPTGWEVRRFDDTRTDIVDPQTGDYVRVAWTDEPREDPYEDRREYSQRFAEEHEDYEEIRLERTTWRGHDAAIWEFAYTDGGRRLRAAQLNLTTGEHGYSLLFQSSADRWDERGHLFERFQEGFELHE